MKWLKIAGHTPNLPNNIVDFRGFDSSTILVLRGGIPRPIGDSPESLSQAILVGCNISRRIGRNTNTQTVFIQPVGGKSLYISISLSLYTYIYIYPSLSLSLSLSVDMYIYIYICIYIYIYIYT